MSSKNVVCAKNSNSVKNKYRQIQDEKTASASCQTNLSNYTPFSKRTYVKFKPKSYKEHLKKINPETKTYAKPCSLKDGQLTNAHKKFLNLINNDLVKKEGCQTCSSSISGLVI